MDISQELAENYEELRKARGWSVEELAQNLDNTDPRLAAHFRSVSDTTAADTAPRGRTSGLTDQTALDQATASTAVADQHTPHGVGQSVDAEREAGVARAEALGQEVTKDQVVEYETETGNEASEAAPSVVNVEKADEDLNKGAASEDEDKTSSKRTSTSRRSAKS